MRELLLRIPYQSPRAVGDASTIKYKGAKVLCWNDKRYACRLYDNWILSSLSSASCCCNMGSTLTLGGLDIVLKIGGRAIQIGLTTYFDKVCGSYSITFLTWIHVFDWCAVRWGSTISTINTQVWKSDFS